MKKCPYCAERIQDEAIICRYCGRDQPKAPSAADQQSPGAPRPLQASWRIGTKVAAVISLIYVVGTVVRYQHAPAELLGSLTIGLATTFVIWSIVISALVSLWRKLRRRNSAPESAPPKPQVARTSIAVYAAANPRRGKAIGLTALAALILAGIGVLAYVFRSPPPANPQSPSAQVATRIHDAAPTPRPFLNFWKSAIPENWWSGCKEKNLSFDALLSRGVCVYGVVTDIHRSPQDNNTVLGLFPGTSQPYYVLVNVDAVPRAYFGIDARNDASVAMIDRGSCIVAYGYPTYSDGTPIFYVVRIADANIVLKDHNDPSLQGIIDGCQ